jgi:peptide chain release factor 1
MARPGRTCGIPQLTEYRMKPSMLAKLDQLANRLVELDELLMSEGATSNMDTYRKMTREHAELGPLVALYKQYQEANGDIAAAQEMLADPDMKEFAQEEIEGAKARLAQLDVELQKMLLPKDENDERNIFLEIRAGHAGRPRHERVRAGGNQRGEGTHGADGSRPAKAAAAERPE